MMYFIKIFETDSKKHCEICSEDNKYVDPEKSNENFGLCISANTNCSFGWVF